MKLSLFLLLFVFVSCSSLEPTPVTPTPTPRIIPHGRAIMVYSEGDSTMYGCHVGEYNGDVQDQTPNNPPALLALDLGITVYNGAKDGSMISDSLDGTDFYLEPLDQRLQQTNAQIVITNSVHNEIGHGVSIETYQANLETWIQAVLYAGKLPIIEEPNPSSCWLDQIPPYIEVQHSLAEKYGLSVIEQWDYILSLPNWQGMLQDCVHPEDNLYEIKARREADVLRPIVERLQQ